MRICATAAAALVALALAGCSSPNLVAFDRPQTDADVIESAAALDLDPESTRLLWEGDNRTIFAAKQNDNSSSMCVVVFAGDVQRPFAACTTGDRLETAIGGGETYALVSFEVGDEAEGWEQLAPGLWRSL